MHADFKGPKSRPILWSGHFHFRRFCLILVMFTFSEHLVISFDIFMGGSTSINFEALLTLLAGTRGRNPCSASAPPTPYTVSRGPWGPESRKSPIRSERELLGAQRLGGGFCKSLFSPNSLSLGFEGGIPRCPAKRARTSRTPGGVQKVRARLFRPL